MGRRNRSSAAVFFVECVGRPPPHLTQIGRLPLCSGKCMVVMLTTSQLGNMGQDNKLKRVESNFRSISPTLSLQVWSSCSLSSVLARARLHQLWIHTQLLPSFLHRVCAYLPTRPPACPLVAKCSWRRASTVVKYGKVRSCK